MIIVESMREAVEMLRDVEQAYQDMAYMADNGPFRRRLGEALGIEEDD